ncbi:MAG: hypothetical protein Q4P24_12790 [Rhodobacterales bacterium]|nr:hypothetical protein [Rhodobacterales bacterium]
MTDPTHPRPTERNRERLTDQEKAALRLADVDPDAPQMSDDEWHEWVGAHNAVVHRKGLGVPIGPGDVEEELARRRARNK